MFKTHLLISFLIGIFTYKYFHINGFLFIGLVILAGILPDIDISNSKVGRKIRPLSNILNIIFGHRGLMHSIFFPVMLFFIFYQFKQINSGYAVLIGYSGHLLADALSYEGINFLYPISRFRIQGFVKVGGLVEYVIFLMLLIAFFTPLPSSSRNSSASFLPVEAPLGTIDVADAEPAYNSTSMVGFPRESRTSRAKICVITVMYYH